jgi:hypothetical protein
MYTIYKNKYTKFKPIETNIRGLGRKKKNRGEELIWVIMHICKEMLQGHLFFFLREQNRSYLGSWCHWKGRKARMNIV